MTAMIRQALVVLLATACSCSRESPAEPPIEAAMLVPPGAVGVFRFGPDNPDDFPLAPIFGKDLGARKEKCWTDLEAAAKHAYQIISMPEPGKYHGFFAIEGDLPRERVEGCIEKALAGADISREGQLSVAKMPVLGRAYLGWRSP